MYSKTDKTKISLKIRPTQNSKSDLAAAKALLEETFAYHAQVAGDEAGLQFRPTAQASYLEECLWVVSHAPENQTLGEYALLAFLVEPSRLKLKTVEKPVGFLMLRIQRDHYYATELYGYVEQLIVTAEARGMGVGAKLLEAAYEWLRSQNIHTATLKVYGSNQDALHFYEHEGFQPLRHELVKHF